jgi:hypothetical protein
LKSSTILFSSLILSLGIITGCFLLSLKLSPVVSETPNHADVQNSILLDIEEASDFLGLSTEELKTVMREEQRMLQSTGSYDGAMLPIIVIDKETFFETTKLLLWAQESAAMRKEFQRD